MGALSSSPAENLLAEFRRVRAWSDTLCQPLETEDLVAQSMPDASPTKWHLAHTTWFFETFVLKPFVPDYHSFNPAYEELFNSYYNAVGPQFPRLKRGLITRPTVAQTWHYRQQVEEAVGHLICDADEATLKAIVPLVTLGIHHEQQHQELMLTDFKHLLARNPLHPVYSPRKPSAPNVAPSEWRFYEGGLYEIGAEGTEKFYFDNEGPRHRVWLEPFNLSTQHITCGQWLEFMADGGYSRSELWLSMGWSAVQNNGWQAPLYWERGADGWQMFTLHGLRSVDESEPVGHISYFEADAFARWSNARLPTEAEWEIAARGEVVAGNFAEEQHFHPVAASSAFEPFGNLWCWTQSQYTPYPGFKADEGALGEYNGKFMCNQFVLRGGSCATPQSHIRASYRNFFPPEVRWQFSGLRLARDV